MRKWVWRLTFVAACVVGFIPYIVISMFLGLHNVIYYFVLWAIFLQSRKVGRRTFLCVTVLCAIALSVPISTFIGFGELKVTDYKTAFTLVVLNYPYHAVARVLYFLVLMFVARYALIKQSEPIETR